MNPDAATAARPRVNRSIRAETPSTPPAADATDAPSERPSAPVTGPRRKARGPGVRARLTSVIAKVRALLPVLYAVCAVALMGVAGREGQRWLVTTDHFAARDVVVHGARRTEQSEILRAANIGDTRNVLSIDCEAAARAIEQLPWVQRARVSRRLPGHVEVTVEERTAVALVAAGPLYLAGGDGTLFKRATPSDPEDLPVITGIAREAFEHDAPSAREAVRDALALLSDVEASAVGAPLRVDEVHREATGDLSLVVGGAQVWLGRGPYRAKLTRLRVVLRELDRRALHAGEIHLESDRHPERVTVRLASR